MPVRQRLSIRTAGLCVWLCLAMMAALAPARAAPPGTLPVPVELPAPPPGPPVLTIHTPDGPRTYTRAGIEALGLLRVTTHTFWPADDGVYEGVPLARLLADAGLAGAARIRVRALDEYSQAIPRADWAEHGLLLATRRDGRLLDIAGKGPLRLIYPRDSDPALAGPGFRLRWVWMIESIEAEADAAAP
ncbi:molybdopterin-dependent oxidoreductase [Plasticicumulans sp.]|uniref:molybdopterin-dependent oxidoreductase n=1 Tax=Plasticicumulans sp. TaxID=2307179 RepID=UPI002C66EBF4|nr:molybdopterin-dependent oxidoreductase [Plasticicumulans sp.]MBS0602028.1 molybdopterin-dependent oxidoreductase [Pseudomonadota bacterium]HMW28688.1 molybdopterin-dependent oxidoreductase [Plasticicumulans sp.]HNJ07978.1 molybdopterin-dependent oxidoreductase [Plasticicumulans sp.]